MFNVMLPQYTDSLAGSQSQFQIPGTVLIDPALLYASPWFSWFREGQSHAAALAHGPAWSWMPALGQVPAMGHLTPPLHGRQSTDVLTLSGRGHHSSEVLSCLPRVTPVSCFRTRFQIQAASSKICSQPACQITSTHRNQLPKDRGYWSVDWTDSLKKKKKRNVIFLTFLSDKVLEVDLLGKGQDVLHSSSEKLLPCTSHEKCVEMFLSSHEY